VANVTDLAKWMMVQLDSGRVRGGGATTSDSGRRLWNVERTKEMWSAQTIQPIDELSPSLADYRPNFYLDGLGWDLRDYRGQKLVTHTGALYGITSRTLILPAARLGMVVLTNGESPLSTSVAFHVLDHYLKAPSTDWTSKLVEYIRSAEAKAHAIEQKASVARQKSSQPSLPLKAYAGRYNDLMYGDATITDEGGKLVLRFSHSSALTGELEHWQYDTFVAHWGQRNIPDIYVTFALKPDGSIDTMKMEPVSPLADFSYDFQDLLFRPAEPRR
jgi:CubicO group peptidase (beta-lactamase class C family)